MIKPKVETVHKISILLKKQDTVQSFISFDLFVTLNFLLFPFFLFLGIQYTCKVIVYQLLGFQYFLGQLFDWKVGNVELFLCGWVGLVGEGQFDWHGYILSIMIFINRKKYSITSSNQGLRDNSNEWADDRLFLI